MSRYQGAYGLTATLLSAAMPVLHGQTAVSQPRTIDVEGGTMRVWTEGIEQRQTGRPVVILESGGHVGHTVHRDDPSLVARLIEHVLKHAPAPTSLPK
jgi:hypothetical protein